jgi:hypothetical protein
MCICVFEMKVSACVQGRQRCPTASPSRSPPPRAPPNQDAASLLSSKPCPPPALPLHTHLRGARRSAVASAELSAWLHATSSAITNGRDEEAQAAAEALRLTAAEVCVFCVYAC